MIGKGAARIEVRRFVSRVEEFEVLILVEFVRGGGLESSMMKEE